MRRFGRHSLASLTLAAVLATGSLLGGTDAHASDRLAHENRDEAARKARVISELTDRVNAMQLAVLERLKAETGSIVDVPSPRGAAPPDDGGAVTWHDDMVVRPKGWTSDAR